MLMAQYGLLEGVRPIGPMSRNRRMESYFIEISRANAELVARYLREAGSHCEPRDEKDLKLLGDMFDPNELIDGAGVLNSFCF
jgi:hypothetical protein